MVRSYVKFLDCIQNFLILWQILYHAAPHRDKDVINPSIMMYAPLPHLPNLKGSLGHGYKLDTYCWTYTMPDLDKTRSYLCMLLLSAKKPQECGTLIAKVDGKAVVHLLRCSSEFVKNVADIMPHCGTNMPPCDPSSYNMQYIMYAPMLPPPSSGLPVHGY